MTCNTVVLDIYTAVLGGEVPVPTLDRPVMLKIPPRTQSSRSFRLRGNAQVGAAQLPGRSYARARLVLPEPMSDREVNAFREMAAARGTRRGQREAWLLVGTSVPTLCVGTPRPTLRACPGFGTHATRSVAT